MSQTLVSPFGQPSRVNMVRVFILYVLVAVTAAQYNERPVGTKNTNINVNGNRFHGNNGGAVVDNGIHGNTGAVYNNNNEQIAGFRGKINNNGDHFDSRNVNNGYQGRSFNSGSFQQQPSASEGKTSGLQAIPRRINVVGGKFNRQGGRSAIVRQDFHGNNGIVGNNFHGNKGIVGSNFHSNNGRVGSNFHGNNGVVGNNFHGNNGIVGSNFHGNSGIVGNSLQGNVGIVGNNFQGNNDYVNNGLTGNNFHSSNQLNGDNFHGNNGLIRNDIHGDGNIGHNNRFEGNDLHGNNVGIGKNQFIEGKERIVGGFVQRENGIVGNFGKNNAVVNNNFNNNGAHGNVGGQNNEHQTGVGIGQSFHGIGASSNQYSRGVISRQMPGRGFGQSVHNGINNGINNGFNSNIGGSFNNGLKGGNFIGRVNNGVAASINSRIHGNLNDQDINNINGPVKLGGANHVQQTNFNNGHGSFGQMNLNGQQAHVGFNGDNNFGNSAFAPNNAGVKYNEGFGTFSNDNFGSDFGNVIGHPVTTVGDISGNSIGIKSNNNQKFVPSNQGNARFVSPVGRNVSPVERNVQHIRTVPRNLVPHQDQSGQIYNGQRLNNGINSFNGGVVGNVGRKPFIQQAVGISGYQTRDVIGDQNHGVMARIQHL